MNVEEIRKKVRSLCEDAGLQFFFAVPNASEWAVTDCEHLRKIVSYHKELETLPLVTPTQNWISVSERLPKDGEIVLITSSDMYLSKLNPWCGWVNGNNWYTFTANGSYLIKYPIAWMPMPKSYKVEKENNK